MPSGRKKTKEPTLPKKGLPQFMRSPLFHLLAIGILTILCYANTFHVPLVFDGLHEIRNNSVVHGLANFFSHDRGYAYNRNRFIGYLTFALNYHFGGLSVVGYHIVNLAIHILNAFLVYALVLLTLRTPFLRPSTLNPQPSTFNPQPSSFIPLCVALLFALHPLQTQAVTYIYQRFSSLAALFYLLSLVLYVRARLGQEEWAPRGNEQRKTKGKGGRTATFLWFAGSLLSALLAMKTKEFSVTLPFIALVYEFSFFRGEWRRRLLYLAPLLLTAPVVPLGVFLPGWSRPAGPSAHAPAAAVSNHLLSVVNHQFRVQTALPRWDYLMTQFRVIVTYLRLLVLPVHQNLDYDYPVYKTFFTPPVFLSFCLLAGLFALASYLYLRTRSAAPRPLPPGCRFIGFGILWFFVTLSVTSSIVPIFDVIYEHRLYLPLFGAAVAAVVAFGLIFERLPEGRKLVIPVLLGVLVFGGFGAATYLRNLVWRSKVSIWSDVVRKSPEKVRGYNNLGAALNGSRQYREAISVLSRAVKLKPDDAVGWYNLGLSYMLSGRYGAAVTCLKKAVQIKSDYADAYVNLGAALNRERRFDETVTLLSSLLRRWGNRADLRFNLGVAYACLGDRAAARRQLTILYRLNPKVATPLANFLR